MLATSSRKTQITLGWRANLRKISVSVVKDAMYVRARRGCVESWVTTVLPLCARVRHGPHLVGR